MPLPAAQETTVVLQLDAKSARRLLYANRFCIEADEGFLITHFTYVSQSGTELVPRSIAMSSTALGEQRASLMEYLQRIDQSTEAKEPRPSWINRQRPETLDPVDVVQCARFHQFAETGFYFASSFMLVEAGKHKSKKKEFPPIDCLGALIVRSPLAMQRDWIVQIYEAYEAIRS